MNEEIVWVHLEEVLTRYEDRWKQHFQELMVQGNHNATGDLINSLKTEHFIDERHFEVNVTLNDYWKYLNSGSKPHYPPIKPIKDWVAVKHIMPEVRPIQKGDGTWVEYCPTVEQLPYMIQKSIAKYGTKDYHTFDQAKNDINEEFAEAITLAIQEDLGNYVSDVLSEYIERYHP